MCIQRTHRERLFADAALVPPAMETIVARCSGSADARDVCQPCIAPTRAAALNGLGFIASFQAYSAAVFHAFVPLWPRKETTPFGPKEKKKTAAPETRVAFCSPPRWCTSSPFEKETTPFGPKEKKKQRPPVGALRGCV